MLNLLVDALDSNTAFNHRLDFFLFFSHFYILTFKMPVTCVTFYNFNLFLMNIYEIYKCCQINTKRISIGLIFKAHEDPHLCPETQTISHFRVHICLLFKASLSVKFSFICKVEVITITKTLHVDSL